MKGKEVEINEVACALDGFVLLLVGARAASHRAPSTSTSTTPPRLATGAPHDTRAMAELVTHMSVWYRARP
jgi:hypothetical protein